MGMGGFPGNLKIRYSLFLSEKGDWASYQVQTDQDSLVNPTNHSYFNLSVILVSRLIYVSSHTRAVYPIVLTVCQQKKWMQIVLCQLLQTLQRWKNFCRSRRANSGRQPIIPLLLIKSRKSRLPLWCTGRYQLSAQMPMCRDFIRPLVDESVITNGANDSA